MMTSEVFEVFEVCEIGEIRGGIAVGKGGTGAGMGDSDKTTKVKLKFFRWQTKASSTYESHALLFGGRSCRLDYLQCSSLPTPRTS